MAVAYHISSEQGLVTVTGSDVVDIGEACDLGRTMLADVSLEPALPHLIDLRGLTISRTPAQSQEFRDFVLTEYATKIQGSIAIVIDAVLDERSCAALYLLTCAVESAELFDSYDQALKWLMKREFVTNS
jgi:hypothetical protein